VLPLPDAWFVQITEYLLTPNFFLPGFVKKCIIFTHPFFQEAPGSLLPSGMEWTPLINVDSYIHNLGLV